MIVGLWGRTSSPRTAASRTAEAGAGSPRPQRRLARGGRRRHRRGSRGRRDDRTARRATFWGGYSGVFIDPDGHPWEVAHNPHWTLGEDGSVALNPNSKSRASKLASVAEEQSTCGTTNRPRKAARPGRVWLYGRRATKRGRCARIEPRSAAGCCGRASSSTSPTLGDDDGARNPRSPSPCSSRRRPSSGAHPEGEAGMARGGRGGNDDVLLDLATRRPRR